MFSGYLPHDCNGDDTIIMTLYYKYRAGRYYVHNKLL